jgi:hypothetical protein
MVTEKSTTGNLYDFFEQSIISIFLDPKANMHCLRTKQRIQSLGANVVCANSGSMLKKHLAAPMMPWPLTSVFAFPNL